MTKKSESMALNQRNKMETFYLIVGCAGWVLGLLLTGSDGPYMPWGNLLGIVVFWGATVLLAHLGEEKGAAKQSEENHDHAPKDLLSCTVGYYD